MKQATITYTFRGLMERGTGEPGYRWVEGYSPDYNGLPTYPWSTKRECQKEARLNGKKAVFVSREDEPCKS